MTANLVPTVNTEAYKRYFGLEDTASVTYPPSNAGSTVPDEDIGASIVYFGFYSGLPIDPSSTGNVSAGPFYFDIADVIIRLGFTNWSTRSFPALFVLDPDIDGSTAKGSRIEKAPDVPTKVYELRRVTGLSWEQLSSVLNVSRRTLHNWATGKEVAVKNEERLARVLSTVRFIDRGSAAENRNLLLSSTEDGHTLVELLREERHQELKGIAGSGSGRSTHRLRSLDEKTRKLLVPERLGERLEQAKSDITPELPEGDGIVRKAGAQSKTKRVSRGRAD